ncbi:MAG TPA: DUF5317 family protein [Candidatus Limnocylindrales bacterium]|nr:DUF5317 family protein [Candidatus Limnocylindrales bacterium]
MVPEAIIAGLVIGFLRNGSLKQLGHINLSGWPLIALSMALQAAVRIDFALNTGFLSAATPLLYVFSFVLLLSFAFLQPSKKSMFLIGLGILLNLLVITANKGLMPVDARRIPPLVREELASGTLSPFHTVMTEDTWLDFLGDRIMLPYAKNQLISIGDIILAGGLMLYVQQNMLKDKRIKKYR